MIILNRIETLSEEFEFSDIHIHVGKPIALRVQGDIVSVGEGFESPSLEDIESFVRDCLDDQQYQQLQENRDIDLALNVGAHRLRLNIYYTLRGLAISLRRIGDTLPEMEELNLPWAVQSVLEEKSGLILVTGSTGSGKSTSLAVMIDHLNRTRSGHILTIEDPIEHIHKDQKCIVSQREVGRDARSFKSALRASLREDPDIILIGEMRDQETIELALTAAETGHLVFGTLHTASAPDTINRIIDAMPSSKQSQVRGQLSQSLQMVLSQQLFKRVDGQGRVAAFELMRCNAGVKNLIRENKIHQIKGLIQTSAASGMMLFERSIEELKLSGIIEQ